MYGWVEERLLDASAVADRSCTWASTAVEASARSAWLFAVMLTWISEEAKPDDAAARVTLPTSSNSATASRTVDCNSAWSASGSVVSEKVMFPPPRKAWRSEDPLWPRDNCTTSTPGMPRSAVSTVVAATFCASRLVPSGTDWLTVRVFCPLSPMKFVLSSGTSAPVPTRMNTATTIVATGRASVQRMIGR